MSPSSQMMTLSSAMPIPWASRAWWTRWRYSPWTGHEVLRARPTSRILSSSCLAWPVAWTRRCRSARRRHRPRWSPSMTLDTLASLPGIGCERDDHGVLGAELDPAGSRCAAMRARADIGSPCEPVEITQTCRARGARSRRCRRAARRGCRAAPSRGPARTFLLHRQAEGGDRPAALDGGVGDLLHAVDVAGEAGGDDPLALVLVEQVAQHVAHRRLRRRCARLLGVGRVGQEQADAPSLGDPPMRARSVMRPSTGVRSSLKSPSAGSCPAACGRRWRSRGAPSG